jgi:hypothetical protein
MDVLAGPQAQQGLRRAAAQRIIRRRLMALRHFQLKYVKGEQPAAQNRRRHWTNGQ